MTKTDELMFMADRYAGIGLGFGDPGPQRDALRTAIEQALAEAREEALTAANRMVRAAIRLEEQAQDTTLMNLQDEVSNLTDELDQLRVDAMRYRWLTSNGLKLLAKDFPDRLSMMQEHTSDEIDAAVDAARGKSENL